MTAEHPFRPRVPKSRTDTSHPSLRRRSPRRRIKTSGRRGALACALVAGLVGLVVAAPVPVAAASPGVLQGTGWQAAAGEAATGLVRLHVVAHSDAAEDQRLKLLVRDALLAQFGGELMALTDEAAVMTWTVGRREAVERLAREVLAGEGAPYGARLIAGWAQFPETRLGAATVPAGRYLAIRLILGAGEGRNWWCVLFPPLCVIDEAQVTELEARPADVAVPAWIPLEGELETLRPVGVEWRSYLLDGPLGQEGSWPLRWAEVQQLMAGAARLMSPTAHAHEADPAPEEGEAGPVSAP
ncbi:MAG TPA: stage II sporulation protein R [Limnochorda sp.]